MAGGIGCRVERSWQLSPLPSVAAAYLCGWACSSVDTLRAARVELPAWAAGKTVNNNEPAHPPIPRLHRPSSAGLSRLRWTSHWPE
jgi:hypothetical protein